MIPSASRIRREAEILNRGGMADYRTAPGRGCCAGPATLDLVMLAREHASKHPYWPYHAALKLGDEKANSILPIQYARKQEEAVDVVRVRRTEPRLRDPA